jgi:excisionase family DNA binding protein
MLQSGVTAAPRVRPVKDRRLPPIDAPAFSVQEAAQHLRKSIPTIYRWVGQGRLELIKVVGSSLITGRSVRQLLQIEEDA